MNRVATSKEELLKASLKLASEKGLRALNIRSIAKECGVSVGCVYGYFPSKAELVSAAVARIWEGIFHMTEGRRRTDDFRECVRWVFGCIRSGCAEYPAFFSQHPSAFDEPEKSEGRRVMEQYLGHIKDALLFALENDRLVKKDSFSGDFTQEKFVDFVFENLLSLGTRRAGSCDFLVTLTEKLIY